MLNGLLPIGSVVLLQESTKRVMIVGVCQRGVSNPNAIWDYVGVVFPEGFMAADKMLMFNNEQIQQIYAIGYQDGEQLLFKEKADKALAEIRQSMNNTEE